MLPEGWSIHEIGTARMGNDPKTSVTDKFCRLHDVKNVFVVDGSSIWDANEAFYVETPREMLEANDFVNPTFNYLPRFNKPVLSYWIVAAFYQLFGVSVAVQRYAIALGALAALGLAEQVVPIVCGA